MNQEATERPRRQRRHYNSQREDERPYNRIGLVGFICWLHAGLVLLLGALVGKHLGREHEPIFIAVFVLLLGLMLAGLVCGGIGMSRWSERRGSIWALFALLLGILTIVFVVKMAIR